MTGGTSNGVTQAQYDDWEYTQKYSGYRYAITRVDLPQTLMRGTTDTIMVTWRNMGVAPTYDTWRITYSVRPTGQPSPADTLLVDSTYNLSTLYYEGNPFTGLTSDPLYQEASHTDSLTVPSQLVPGTYSLYVTVHWDQHKSSGTNPVSYPPMALSMPGRTSDGAYLLGTITVQ